MAKIAYLMNSYPMTSTTFIRREIEALEKQGVEITRYAVRHWDGELVDPDDIEEQRQTHYLLTGNASVLIGAFLSELLKNPAGVIRSFGPWMTLLRNARGGLIRHIAYLLQAAYLRGRAKADGIAHIHVHFGTNATAVAMLSRLMGGPSYSFTVHGPDELTDAPLLSFPQKIEHAEFVSAISHFCKSQLIRFSSIRFSEKIKIVHCGLALDGFHPTPAPDNNTFVCVGRLCPQKGQAQLPAAVAALRDDFPNMKVVLIGDGESRADIESEIARYGVEDQIEILGWVENRRVREAVANGKTFLLPSFAEGLPVVIMEALALGRPVISTYIAGIPELLDHECGWIIPAGSHDALVDALRSALSASAQELAAKGEEGRLRVEREHDVDKEAEKLRILFEAAIEEKTVS